MEVEEVPVPSKEELDRIGTLLEQNNMPYDKVTIEKELDVGDFLPSLAKGDNNNNSSTTIPGIISSSSSKKKESTPKLISKSKMAQSKKKSTPTNNKDNSTTTAATGMKNQP